MSGDDPSFLAPVNEQWSVLMFRRAAVAAVFAMCGITVVLAQNLVVIKQRREAMQAIADANFSVWDMYKGQAPFKLSTAQAALKAMQNQFGTFKDLFPDNSKEGGATAASHLIWKDKTGFNIATDAAIVAIRKAAEATKDAASFRTAYKAVRDSCDGCHKLDGGYTIRLSESFKKPKP